MIEFALPDEIKTRENLGQLALEGTVSFTKFDDDKITAKWTLDDKTVNVTYDLATRTISIANGTPKARANLIQKEIDKHNNRSNREAGIRALCEMAQTAVGLPMEQLSKGETDAVLKLLLLSRGALEFDEDGATRIKPLKKWVKSINV